MQLYKCRWEGTNRVSEEYRLTTSTEVNFLGEE